MSFSDHTTRITETVYDFQVRYFIRQHCSISEESRPGRKQLLVLIIYQCLYTLLVFHDPVRTIASGT